MPVSFGFLLLALAFYIPFLLTMPENYTPEDDIIIDKEPWRILLYSAYVVVLAISALYEYLYVPELSQIPELFPARILLSLIAIGLASISTIIRIKGYKLIMLDYFLLILTIATSAWFVVGGSAAKIFGYVFLTQFVWSMFKFINRVNIN